MTAREYVSENGTYIIPVTWEVYSTIRVYGAKNLEDAIEYAKEHSDLIPLGDSEYIDGSYQINIENDDEAINAQNYAEISGVRVDVGQFE